MYYNYCAQSELITNNFDIEYRMSYKVVSQSQGGINPIFIILTLLFLTFYSIASSFIQHHHLPIHKSAVAIITGIIAGFAIFLYSDTNYEHIAHLNDEIVYSILYPPMIFAAGFNLKKKAFVNNLNYIAMFGIIGTFAFFVVVVLLFLWANQLNLVRDAKDINIIRELSIWEILLLGACFCSIDTIASEEAISSRKFPKLYSIVFGEGIFKDAVTIVLFRSILRLQELQDGTQFIFLWYTPFQILLNFILLVICSCLQGIAMSLIVIYLFKKCRFLLYSQGINQTIIVFLNGFCIYSISQYVYCSGIISVLVYGLMLNHWGTYNMSKKGVEIAKSTFQFTSIICQGVLFLIMGIVVWQGKWANKPDTTSFSSPSMSYTDQDDNSEQPNTTHSYIFALCVFIILIIGRTVNVLIVVGLQRLFSKKFTIKKQQVIILIISGLVKGATPFALFSSVQLGGNSSYSRNQGMVLKTTVILIIIFTSIFLNSLIPKLYKKPLGKLEQFAKQQIISNRQQQRKKKRRPALWTRLQQNYIKPMFIFDYDQRKEEINKIKQLNHKLSFIQAMKELGEERVDGINCQLLTEEEINGGSSEGDVAVGDKGNDVSLLTIEKEQLQH